MTCGSSILTTGPSFEAKTIGYSSRFLAYGTLEIPGPRCDEYVVAGGFHTIDFSKLYMNPIATTTMTKPGCPPYVNPRLSLPADLTTVDPAWANCQPLFYGAFDPPRFLTKVGGGLVPSNAIPTAVENAAMSDASSASAVAQATPNPATPAMTSTTSAPPSNFLRKLVSLAQETGPPDLIQSSKVLPASPDTRVSLPEASSSSSRQSTLEALDPASLSPDQLSTLHQALQSITLAEPARSQETYGIAVVDSVEASAATLPTRANRQDLQASAAYSKVLPDSQKFPQTGARAAPNTPYVMTTQTQNGPTAPLIDPGDGVTVDVVNAALTLESSQPTTVSVLLQGDDPLAGIGLHDEFAIAESSGVTRAGIADVFGDRGTVAAQHGAEQTPTPLAIGKLSVQILSGFALLVASQILIPGSQATLSGAVVSVGDSRATCDGTDDDSPIVQPQSMMPSINEQTSLQGAPDVCMVAAGQTSTLDGPATVSAIVVSVVSDNFAIDGKTLMVNEIASQRPEMSDASTPLSIAGHAVQETRSDDLVFSGQTTPLGAQVTISGVVVSAGTSNAVENGTIRPSLPQIAVTATPWSVPNHTYSNSTIASTSGSSVVTYTGSSTSGVTKPTDVPVMDTTTLSYTASRALMAASKPTSSDASGLASGAKVPLKASAAIKIGKLHGLIPCVLSTSVFAFLQHVIF